MSSLQTSLLPPTIAPGAAARWEQRLHTNSPWLHEEVARRMEVRLQWIKLQPRTWVHWEPLRGGVQAHGLLSIRYPKSQCFVVQAAADAVAVTKPLLAPSWWSTARWTGPTLRFGKPAQPAQLVWANMALHMAADPQGLIGQWHSLLEENGFLMFSCLGPDTLRELRALYSELGWPPPSHAFTDMHDWGDMLVQAGFAEPVMDMERITLTFASPERLLRELRELGRNLHPLRFVGLRGRGWYTQLLKALGQMAHPDDDGQLRLTFEVVYGHAFKAVRRAAIGPETRVSLDEMRASLRKIKKNDTTD